MNRELKFISLIIIAGLSLLIFTPLYATIIEDPDVGDLLSIDLGLAGDTTKISESVLFEEGEEGLEYSGEETVVEYESPFSEPLKEGDVRFWVDEERGWIEYRIPEDTVVLKSQSEVEYSDIHLKADEISYHTDTKIVEAEGESELADSEGLIEGDRMTYSFETKKGLVYEGESKIEKGFYKADVLKKIGEDEYCGKMGDFTTCEFHHKHYYFWSPKVKVYPGDKIVAKPVVLLIHDIPIFALPYYIMDLKRERHSGFLFPHIRYIGGDDSYFIVNNGYYWAINDDCDLTFLLDYNSRRGWGQKVNYVYTYGSNTGLNSSYFSHYRDRTTQSEWWKIYSTHRQDFGERTNLLLRLDFMNDTSFDKYFDESFEMRTRKDIASYLTFTKNTDVVNFSIKASRTTSLTQEEESSEKDLLSGDEQTTKDTLPGFSISGNKFELFGSRLYLGWSGRAENKYEDGELVSRMGEIKGNLSFPFKLLRYLRINPTLNTRGQWHYVDKDGNHNRFFGTYDTSVSASTNIYGIFQPGDRELRHKITPSVTHHYSPQYNTEWMLSGGGEHDESHRVSFGVGNAFILFPPKDSDGETVNFLDVNQSISYNFKSEDRKFSNLSTTIDFTPNFSPLYYLQSRITMSHNLYDRLLSSLYIQTSFTLNTEYGTEEDEEEDEDSSDEYYEEDPFREETYGGRELGIGKTFKKGLQLSLNHTFSKSHGSSGVQSLDGSISYAITKNWRLSYRTYYDITNNEFTRQSFSIYRDLHCWEGRIAITYSRGNVEYWFEIRIKDIPEVRVQGEQRREL